MVKVSKFGLVKIGAAAKRLGVSISTLRRWDASGKFLPSVVTPGGTRLYSKADITKFYLAMVFLAISRTRVTKGFNGKIAGTRK